MSSGSLDQAGVPPGSLVKPVGSGSHLGSGGSLASVAPVRQERYDGHRRGRNNDQGDWCSAGDPAEQGSSGEIGKSGAACHLSDAMTRVDSDMRGVRFGTASLR